MRALAILDYLADRGAPAAAKEIAAARRLTLGTTYHLLASLADAGYVAKDHQTYTLGASIARLYDAFERQLDPGPRLLAAMDRVAESTGETAYVSRWRDGDVITVAVREGRRPVRVGDVSIGMRGHAHARASGKVLLAYAPPRREREYLSRVTLEARTPHTITDAEELRQHLAGVREIGFAVDNQEFVLGVHCIAAPVFDGDGDSASAALTVMVPASRFSDERASVLTAVLAAAKDASSPVHGEGQRDGKSPVATTTRSAEEATA